MRGFDSSGTFSLWRGRALCICLGHVTWESAAPPKTIGPLPSPQPTLRPTGSCVCVLGGRGGHRVITKELGVGPLAVPAVYNKEGVLSHVVDGSTLNTCRCYLGLHPLRMVPTQICWPEVRDLKPGPPCVDFGVVTVKLREFEICVLRH